jgi:glutamate transport system permease protein
MSNASVLYDAPGPCARRKAAITGVIATIVVLTLLGLVVKRLADQGQLAGKLWGPVLSPSNESFPLVWNLLAKGVVATLTAAVLAIGFSLIVGSAVGVARMMLGHWARLPVVAGIELFRGLPVVITIYFASRVLPELGVDLSGMPGGSGPASPRFQAVRERRAWRSA